MRVLLLQLDGKLPNLALMRISAHHRALGDVVEFRNARTVAAVQRELWDRPERVYASTVFSTSAAVAYEVRRIYPEALIGGTGVDELDGWPEPKWATIEEHGITTRAKDYSLYPKFTASMGFTQRGCTLKCKFCCVPRKEGPVREDESLEEVWRGEPYPKHLHLLDNDFFGQKRWPSLIEAFNAGKFKVCWNQGINARFLNDETARAIASTDYRDDQFRAKRIYTAWDNLKDEERLFAGLEALARHGVKPQNMMVYMIIGFWPNETHESRERRRKKLRVFGARPYPMPFVRTPELVAYQRWVLAKSSDKTIPWDDWVRSGANMRRAAATNHRRSLPVLEGI